MINSYIEDARDKKNAGAPLDKSLLPLHLSYKNTGNISSIRSYSTLGSGSGGLSSYKPGWITGFVDGEGSFGVQCIISPSNRIG